jgi:hypothetical protein
MEIIEFMVKGSALTPYQVTFARDNNEVFASCSCPAGENGTYCKHRINILDGVLEGVVSENAYQVKEVALWLPGSNLERCLAELASATRAVENARHAEAQAKKKLAVAMVGRTQKPRVKNAKRETPPTRSLTAVAFERPSMETGKVYRVPLTSIDFSGSRGETKGYAKGWYFWVHSAFQEALDIRVVELMDKEKTAALRDKKSLELFGVTHDALKRGIEASGKKIGDSKEHKQIMTFRVGDGGRLTESINPQYEFRVTDGLESRSGEWYVQVDQTAETDGAPGSIGFKLYSRNCSPLSDEGTWTRRTWLSTSQQDFVTLLRTGRCSVIDLENPRAFGDE